MQSKNRRIIKTNGVNVILEEFILPLYVIKIYRDDIFLGYLYDFTLNSNKYHFKKTKNIDKARRTIFQEECEGLSSTLTIMIDKNKYKSGLYGFQSVEITEKEIRKSKLERINKNENCN